MNKITLMKKKLHIPKFQSEAAERAFWKKMNLAQHFSSSDFEAVSFPNLKPTSRSVSIRIPEYMISRVKEQANAIDIPYQTLIKQYIAAGLTQKQ